MIWAPPVILDEIEDVKREDGIHGGSNAMKEIVKYARVGREVSRLVRLDFGRSKKQMPVEAYPKINSNIIGWKTNKNKKKNPLRGLL